MGYGFIYHVKGTALVRRDLRRARVDEAAKAVVLSDPYQADIYDRSADAPALLALLNIEAMSPKKNDIFVTVEFVHQENIKLIGRGPTYSAELFGQNVMPGFVAGQVFAHSMLHSVICQVYYNPHLLRILRRLIFNVPAARPGGIKTAASGTISTTTTTTSSPPVAAAAKPQSATNGATTAARKQGGEPPLSPTRRYQRQDSLLYLSNQSGITEHGMVYQIPLPEPFRSAARAACVTATDVGSTGHGEQLPQVTATSSAQVPTYGTLYAHLLRAHGALPLGLYRRGGPGEAAGGRGGKYTVVNPPPGLKLREDDRVFVLCGANGVGMG
ncbi:hypothetical protein HK102_002632 [Quaeritorhiza haematococci]|nr:hypothetical protein HK102_002632 [Quaeritorhiza haematococci]